MSGLKFIPGKFDSDRSKLHYLTQCIHLSIEVAHDDGSVDCFGGWVRPEVAALVKAAPKVLAALKKIRDEYRILGDDSYVAVIDRVIAEAEGRS